MWLRGNKIKDISPLKDLEHLLFLGLSNNPINDFSVLNDFYAIEQLFFEKGATVDISKYKNTKNIEFFISWIAPNGRGTGKVINLDKIKHLKKVTFDDEFINKYAEVYY